jgi:hypothetical protein
MLTNAARCDPLTIRHFSRQTELCRLLIDWLIEWIMCWKYITLHTTCRHKRTVIYMFLGSFASLCLLDRLIVLFADLGGRHRGAQLGWPCTMRSRSKPDSVCSPGGPTSLSMRTNWEPGLDPDVVRWLEATRLREILDDSTHKLD